MQVLTIVSQKGGVSKSTLAAHLAVEAMNAGQRVLILELARQGTASTWHAQRGRPPEVIEIKGNEVDKSLTMARAGGTDIVILDLPGSHGPSARWAIRAADLVLIPSRPNDVDLNSAADTRTLVADYAKPCAFVLTFVQKEKEAAEMRKNLTDIGESVAPVSIVLRPEYVQAIEQGRVVSELGGAKGKPSPAAQEIHALWTWVSERLQPAAAAPKLRAKSKA